MQPRDLTEQQRRILAGQCARQLEYLSKLVRRLDAIGMDRGSTLYREAVEAHDAALRLRMETHYLSLPEGQVG